MERVADEERAVKAAVSGAIAVVDLIEKRALSALTVAWIVQTVRPRAEDSTTAMAVLNSWVQPFVEPALPQGERWINHLNVGGLLTPIQAGIATLKRFRELWPGAAHLDAADTDETPQERFPAAREVGQWWNSIDPAFTFTSVGIAVAHANASHIAGLPPLSRYLAL
jgi:hypothetical protein